MIPLDVAAWDKCHECEHYRGEHEADGGICKCLIISGGFDWICECAEFEEPVA